jgi:hypothetical protein
MEVVVKICKNNPNGSTVSSDIECDCCSKLCIEHAKIGHLCTCSMTAKRACVEDLESIKITAQDESVNTLCVSVDLKAGHAGIDTLNSNHLCSQDGTINRLCVNDLTVGNLNHCAKWRAAVTFNADTPYVLGTNVEWNTILDDPNGNVSIGPFSYTVPVSGYYVLNYHLNSNSLAGAITLAGVPIGLLGVLVNGLQLLDDQAPFLTFSNSQTATLSGVVLLNAGDIIKMKYNVLVMDPASGFILYVGSVNLEGNGSFPGQSFFTIHYLSSLNCTPVTCQPCAPVEIPCQPMTIVCDCRTVGSTNPGSCSSC